MKTFLASLHNKHVTFAQNDETSVTGVLINIQSDYCSLFTQHNKLVHYPYSQIKSVKQCITELPRVIPIPDVEYPETFEQLIATLNKNMIQIENGSHAVTGLLSEFEDGIISLVLNMTESLHYPIAQVKNILPLFKESSTNQNDQSGKQEDKSQKDQSTKKDQLQKEQSGKQDESTKLSVVQAKDQIILSDISSEVRSQKTPNLTVSDTSHPTVPAKIHSLPEPLPLPIPKPDMEELTPPETLMPKLQEMTDDEEKEMSHTFIKTKSNKTNEESPRLLHATTKKHSKKSKRRKKHTNQTETVSFKTSARPKHSASTSVSAKPLVKTSKKA